MKVVAGKRKNFFNKFIWYGIVFCIGTIFLLLFSISTSPLLENTYGSDSAFFQMVGQSMVKGQIIYKDIFDNKGPYLYLIEYWGQVLSYGRCGIFVLQLFSLYICLYFVDRTCCMICCRNTYGVRGLSMFIFFLLLGLTLDGGNLSEEFSLPVLIICLYLFFWYLNNYKKNLFISIFFGLSLGFLVFIRMTNAGFICILITVMFVEMILNKRFRILFEWLTGIAVGFLGAVIPVCIYCIYKGIFSEMLYATFGFNFLYATHDAGKIRFEVICILLVTTLLSVWINRKERICVIFSIMNLIGTVGILLLGHAYIHYYQLIIPPVLTNVWLSMRKYDMVHFPSKNIFLAMVCLFLIFMNGGTLMYQSLRVIYAFGFDSPKKENSVLESFAYMIEDRYAADWQENYGYRAAEQVSDLLAQISVDAYNSVYNYNTRPYWLRVSGLRPYNKYCQTQESFISINSQIKDEIDAMFCLKPPQYIVIENYESICNDKMLRRLNEQYFVKYQNEVYTLYECGDE